MRLAAQLGELWDLEPQAGEGREVWSLLPSDERLEKSFINMEKDKHNSARGGGSSADKPVRVGDELLKQEKH